MGRFSEIDSDRNAAIDRSGFRLFRDCDVPFLSETPGAPGAPGAPIVADACTAAFDAAFEPPKPCPFCGGEPVLMIFAASGKFAVACESCRACGPHHATDLGAIAAWEHRHA